MSLAQKPIRRSVHRRALNPGRSGIDCTLVLRIAALCALAVSPGCGKPARLEVAPVKGRVVYKGQGIPKATVIFIPQGESAENVGKIRPFAYADDAGNFQMKTYVDGDGAPPGDYRVSIVAFSSGGAPRTKDGPVGAAAAPASGVRIPPAISKKFADVETAGLSVTIHEGENNLDPFDLGQTVAQSAAAGSSAGAAN